MKIPDILVHDGADEMGTTHIMNIRKAVNNKWGIHSKKEFLRAFNDNHEVNYEIIANLSRFKYPPALYVLAEMYLYGIEPVTMNITKAYELYSEASVLGFHQAYSPMAFIKKFGLEENAQPNRVLAEISEYLGVRYNSYESIFSIIFDILLWNKKYGRTILPHEAFILKNYLLQFQERYTNPTFKFAGFSNEGAEVKLKKKLTKYKAKYNSGQSYMQLAISYFNGDSGFKKNYTKAAEYAEKLGENHTLYKTVKGFDYLSKGDTKNGRMSFIDGYQNNDQFSQYCERGVSITYNDAKTNSESFKLGSDKVELLLNNHHLMDDDDFRRIKFSLDEAEPSFGKYLNEYRFYLFHSKYHDPYQSLVSGINLWNEVNPNIPNQNIAYEWYFDGKVDSAIMLLLRIANTGSINAADTVSNILLSRNLPGKDRNYTLKVASLLHKFVNICRQKTENDDDLFKLSKKYNFSIQTREDEKFNKVHITYVKLSKADDPYQLVIKKLEGNLRTKLLSVLVNLKILYLVFPNINKTLRVVFILSYQLKLYSLIILFLLCWRVKWLLFKFLTEKRKAMELEAAKEEENAS